jgi:serine/threonine-protein kinase
MKKFGAYEILHELKSGGMGSVLLARRRGPGAFEQLVAIKTIRPEHAGTPAVRAMFLDEAAILARLNHPGVATVHDFGEEAGSLYMVMEYVAGIPFRDLVEHRPPPAVLARAIAEACRGLHAAHELRDLGGHPLDLVHRDISPDNLMLGFDGHVKVIDFGIALVKKNRQAPVTEFGTVKGKPPYMSPEQVANEAMDRRSDIFSLAVVLWELLTERSLFDGDSIYAIALAVANQPIARPSQYAGELPYGLDAAIMNALDRDRTRRTPTAAAFAEQLEQVIQHAGGETLEAWAERALAAPREHHRTWLASVIIGSELPKAVGRATGQVTEVAALGRPKTPAAPIAAAPPLVPEHKQPTSIGGTALDDLSIPPRNRLAPIAIVLLLLLAVGGGAYFLLRNKAVPVVAHDAALDAEVTIPAPDAASADAPIEIPVDATVDAGVRVVTIRADAGRPTPRDAAIAIVKPDATIQPVGSGFITIKYKPGPYAEITVDGDPIPGPVIRARKIAAGRHTIRFLDPKTKDVLDEQVITIGDAETIDVRQR